MFLEIASETWTGVQIRVAIAENVIEVGEPVFGGLWVYLCCLRSAGADYCMWF